MRADCSKSTIEIVSFVGGGGGSVERPPAKLGEHTDEVLREAGYAEADIAEMRQQAVDQCGGAPFSISSMLFSISGSLFSSSGSLFSICTAYFSCIPLNFSNGCPLVCIGHLLTQDEVSVCQFVETLLSCGQGVP